MSFSTARIPTPDSQNLIIPYLPLPYLLPSHRRHDADSSVPRGAPSPRRLRTGPPRTACLPRAPPRRRRRQSPPPRRRCRHLSPTRARPSCLRPARTLASSDASAWPLRLRALLPRTECCLFCLIVVNAVDLHFSFLPSVLNLLCPLVSWEYYCFASKQCMFIY